MPWTEEPGRLQPMGLQRVRHDWAHTHMHKSTSQEASHKRRALSRAVGEDGADARFLESLKQKTCPLLFCIPSFRTHKCLLLLTLESCRGCSKLLLLRGGALRGQLRVWQSDGWNHNYEDQEHKSWAQKAMRASCPYFCPWMWLHQFTLVSTLGKSEKLSGGWQITWTLPKRN